jgi:uncharacterized LabA/DUF88 family protein
VVNLRSLCEAFTHKHSQTLGSVYYFSAYATWQPRKVSRHRAYVKALQSVGVTIVLGQFKEKDRRCPACRNAWKGHEEKETDVNIAIAMLSLGFGDTYDRAFLVSQDSDLAPAVRSVVATAMKQVTVITPPHRPHSTELIGASHGDKAKVSVDILERSLLPQEVYDAGGNIIARRPPQYDPPGAP